MNKENTGKTEIEKKDEIQKAMETLKSYLTVLGHRAVMKDEEIENLWERMKASPSILQEFAYFHDFGDFLCKYSVAGYTIADILVWQVDHFKAYLDRREEVNRYRREKLVLMAFDILLQMEKDPDIYVEKMQTETGTDFEGKY